MGKGRKRSRRSSLGLRKKKSARRLEVVVRVVHEHVTPAQQPYRIYDDPEYEWSAFWNDYVPKQR
jgi:hypothetical protein